MSALSGLPSQDAVWIGIGFVGQMLFFMRFFVQWIASEREGRTVLPLAFWYFSIAGGAVLLAYALWRRDPIFVLGQATGLMIYARNLFFLSGRAVSDGTRDEPVTGRASTRS